MRTTIPALTLLALVACAPGADDDMTGVPADTRISGGVAYRADTEIMESFPVQLATTVTARNLSDVRVDVTFPDGCVALLRVYDDSTRAGAPAWDQQRAVGCTMAVVPMTLEPGDSARFRTGADAATILGDSLPDGRYWLNVLLRPDGDTVLVPAGVADLAVQR